MPVEQPTKFELRSENGEEIGITNPAQVLTEADGIIK